MRQINCWVYHDIHFSSHFIIYPISFYNLSSVMWLFFFWSSLFFPPSSFKYILKQKLWSITVLFLNESKYSLLNAFIYEIICSLRTHVVADTVVSSREWGLRLSVFFYHSFIVCYCMDVWEFIPMTFYYW